jgi:hypothetical protein
LWKSILILPKAPALFVGGLFAGAMIGWFIAFPPNDSASAASWVQAVGSIAAIVIALRIGREQNKTALEAATNAQRFSENGRQRAVMAIVGAAHEFATSVRSAFAGEDVAYALLSVYDPKVVSHVVSALEVAPLTDVGSPDGVGALLSLRLQFVLLGNAVDTFVAGPWKHPHLGKNLADYESDASFDWQLLADLVASGTGVLKHNVHIHLDVIDADFSRLQRAIGNHA